VPAPALPPADTARASRERGRDDALGDMDLFHGHSGVTSLLVTTP
jgi:hypothetical protein